MSDEQAAPEATDLGEIPSTITVSETPAATDARDMLLQAIGQEARHIAEKSAGQASTALEVLARAYALVVSSPVTVALPGTSTPTGRLTQVNLDTDYWLSK
ncbi:hypothetical protein [Nocardia sp. NPDC051570]|uniref:hypothetical protein n=1 Tax=Nocardia sp. NPDC051570 TaxID=3364324 RepID=UPI0037BAF69C